jgi:hypothetical protein
MNARQELLGLIDELSEAQIAILLPLVLSVRNQSPETPSSEASQSYSDWLSPTNNIYDEAFAQLPAMRLTTLRQAIQQGIDQADQGEFSQRSIADLSP